MNKHTFKYTAGIVGAIAMIMAVSPMAMAQEKGMEPMSEEAIQHHREIMEKRFATMDTDKLMKRKEMLEKRLADDRNSRKKEYYETELDVINSILNK